jgi:hypothetical protein
MTDDQVNRIVEHLCQHLHVAIRLKGTQPTVRPPNLKDLGLAELEQNQVGFRDFARAGMSRIKGLDSRSR